MKATEHVKDNFLNLGISAGVAQECIHGQDIQGCHLVDERVDLCLSFPTCKMRIILVLFHRTMAMSTK